MQGLVDLHVHSYHSDGSDSPAELARGLEGASVVALTDHDSLAGLGEFAAALPGTVRVVEGVELSVRWPERGTFHLLVYGAGMAGSPLREILERQRAARAARNRALLERASGMGIDLPEQEVLAAAGVESFEGKSVGRPHFARVLLDRGYVSSLQEAFDRFLAKGMPLYLEGSELDPAEALGTARDLGMVPVIAHPLSLELGHGLAGMLRDLKRAGLAGVECYYGAYAEPAREELAAITAGLGLIATGGSDYHGSFKPDLALRTGYGDLDVPLGCGLRLADAVANG